MVMILDNSDKFFIISTVTDWSQIEKKYKAVEGKADELFINPNIPFLPFLPI